MCTHPIVLLLLPLLAGCQAEFALGPPYVPCAADGTCPGGCTCLDHQVCVPADPFAGPEACTDPDRIRCQENRDCLKIGCTCRGGYCEPGALGADPQLCKTDTPPFSCVEPADIIVVDSEADDAQVGNEMTLRRALEIAAARPGPRRIAFSMSVGEILLNSALPSVPPLTVLDGYTGHEAEPVTLRPARDTQKDFDGLTVAGAGIVVLNLRIQEFGRAGLRILPGSDDVHLYRLDLRKNDLGLAVGDAGKKTTRVFFSRLLEIPPGACLPEETHDGGEPVASYDIHRVVSNRLGGVRIENAEDVLIEGAWVGFSNLPEDQDAHGNAALGNGGDGILLDGVHRAHLGALHLPEQAAQPYLWDGPSSVAAGRAGQAALRIVRSGDIRLQGLQLNDTPVLNPYDESGDAALVIEENDGPVSYGGTAQDRDAAGWQLNIVHTETTAGIAVKNSGAPVWLRGIQVQCYWGDCQHHAVEILAPRARVDLAHLAVVGEFKVPPLKINGPGEVSVVNCLFRNNFDSPSFRPSLLATESGAQVTVRRLVRWDFPVLCSGDACGQMVLVTEEVVSGSVSGCATVNSSAAWPDTPQCPGVDGGEDLGLDLNGIGDGDFFCAPDIGCFECRSQGCRNACP